MSSCLGFHPPLSLSRRYPGYGSLGKGRRIVCVGLVPALTRVSLNISLGLGGGVSKSYAFEAISPAAPEGAAAPATPVSESQQKSSEQATASPVKDVAAPASAGPLKGGDSPLSTEGQIHPGDSAGAVGEGATEGGLGGVGAGPRGKRRRKRRRPGDGPGGRPRREGGPAGHEGPDEGSDEFEAHPSGPEGGPAGGTGGNDPAKEAGGGEGEGSTPSAVPIPVIEGPTGLELEEGSIRASDVW